MTYSGLHKNWLFAYFEKITVAVGWVYITVWPKPHLKALTPTFWPTNDTFENLKVTGLSDMISHTVQI